MGKRYKDIFLNQKTPIFLHFSLKDKISYNILLDIS